MLFKDAFHIFIKLFPWAADCPGLFETLYIKKMLFIT